MRSLTFLWLSKPEEAVKRVAQRVKQGGHNVPEESIVRRYYSGIKNLILHYLPLADEAFILDNSSQESSKRLVARKNKDDTLDIIDKSIWERIEEIADER